MSLKERIQDETLGREPDEVDDLQLDNCNSGGGIDGLFDTFSNLVSLSLSGCKIRSLVGFPALVNLEILELADNSISGGLDVLVGCTNLVRLVLSNNKGLKDFDAFEPLINMSQLRQLDVSDCDIASIENYAEDMFEMVPHLEYIDDHDREGRPMPSDDEDAGGGASDDSESEEDGDGDVYEDDEDDDDEEEPLAVEEDEDEYSRVAEKHTYDDEDEDDDDDDDEDQDGHDDKRARIEEQQDATGGFAGDDDEEDEEDEEGDDDDDDDDDEEEVFGDGELGEDSQGEGEGEDEGEGDGNDDEDDDDQQ